MVILAIVVGLLVPGIRNKVRNAIDPTYHPVALAEPIPSAVAKCSDATLPHTHLSADNTTLYWVTGPVGGPAQSVTVSFASTTSINRVRVSANVEATSAPTAGAVPHPLQLQFSTGAAAPVTETLSDPPQNVQAVSLNIAKPTNVRITLVATDPGAVAGSCAETAFIFDHKN